MIISTIRSVTQYSKVMLASGMLLCTSVGAQVYADTLPDFASLVKNEGKAVVNIAVTSAVKPASLAGQPGLEQIPEQYRRFFGQPGPQQRGAPNPQSGVGSGFIVSDDGYILTNAHVVNDADQITVRLRNRTELKAELIGLDKLTDVALLKVEADELPTVRIASSDNVAVGEWVLAIGSPFGFDQTATQGIVSAVSRNLPSDNYVPFIQTDVAVNPGNSGGPLFNTEGEVIGINAQIYSSTGGYQGLSFAIPIDIAMNVAEQLKETGQISRGWLGVGIQDVSPTLAESFGLDRVAGALVSSVETDSPADRGGIKEGDIVLNFNGKPVNRSSELPSLVGNVRSGQQANVTVFRDGKNTDLVVTIGQRGQESVASAEVDSILGMEVTSLSSEDLDKLGLEHGLGVVGLTPNSLASMAGIQVNDILVQLNGKPMTSVDKLHAVVGALPAGKPVPVLVQRGDSALFLTFRINDTME